MTTSSVVIIGAGMSGLCMAIKLLEAGIRDFVLLEKNDDLGGTWHDNAYPGACCDVPAALYSYSFAPNPGWSRVYPPQAEIEGYFQACADKYQLRDHIQFGCEVVSAKYQQQQGGWQLTLADGRQYSTRVLVSGVGQLNLPFIPELPGANTFQGRAFHSARWQRDVNFAGKRVAVVGNAASAIQLIPPLAEQADKLYIYQRSANYIIPRNDHLYGDLTQRVFRALPITQKLVRLFYYLRQELLFYGGMVSGSLRGRLLSWMARRYLQQVVKDSSLWPTLTPDYPLGCKRVLVSDDYYQSLNNHNVDIVTSPITAISDSGLCSEDGHDRPVDIIVYATGFRATELLAPMTVVGEGGQQLNPLWSTGAEAHRGVALAGFPNFYMLYGPNTNLGHSSIIFMVEQQVGYVVQCIKKIFDENLVSLQPKQAAQASFNRQIQQDLQDTVWSGDCGSWYKNAEGKITNNWPHTTTRFAREMRKVKFEEYEWLECK